MSNPSEFAYFQNKTVLVTGGAGFIGSHLCDALLAAGAKVIAVDNYITGAAKNIEHLRSNADFTFIEADVSQAPEAYLLKDVTFDLILHFASPASPPGYQAKPVETYLVNSIGTHNLLQYVLAHQANARFLFASTSEVYGDPEVHPQPESYWGNVNPNGVRSCYDEAKRLGETICGVHHRDFGVDVRIVRIFNTYGPRIDLEDGRVIPDFIKNVLHDTPLQVYGDGSQTRSFCYVDDLVRGILLFAAHDQLAGETINLGNPGEFTILEAAKVMQELAGKELQVEYQPLPKDDPTRRRPDITKAKKLLNWEPMVDFKTGLGKTLAYFKA